MGEPSLTITVITAHDLHEQPHAILRRVREEGETIEVLNQGAIVAWLVRPEPRVVDAQERDAVWAEWDELAAEIGKHWPEGVPAVDAVREQRRDR